LFSGATSFNGDVSNWDVSNVTNFGYNGGMFSGATSFDQDLSNWDISNASFFYGESTAIFEDSGLTTQNYTNILIGWAETAGANGGLGNVGPSGSRTTYLSTAQTARDILTDTYGWTINDGGPAYTLTYTAGTNASLVGSGSQIVDNGEDGTAVEVVPDTNFAFIRWSDGSTENPRTDTSVSGDVSVTAVVEQSVFSGSKVPDRKGGGSSSSNNTDSTTNDTSTTTKTTIIGKAQAGLSILSMSPDELANLPDDEKRRVVDLLSKLIEALLEILERLKVSV